MKSLVVDVSLRDKILDILKKSKGQKLATSKIASKATWNFFRTMEILDLLEKEGFLKKIKQNKYIYWEINDRK
jgi:predicted transcriptional regulator